MSYVYFFDLITCFLKIETLEIVTASLKSLENIFNQYMYI